MLFQDSGQFDEAITCYRKVIELDPGFLYAYNNLAIALKEKGRLDEAIAWCRRAIELDPTFAQAQYNLANAMQDRGQLEEAAALYRKTIQYDPSHVGAYTNLGNVFRSRGQSDKAEIFYRHALQINPADLTPYEALLMAMNYNPVHDARAIFYEHVKFAKLHAEHLKDTGARYANARVPDRRLRIGYVSPDFRRHPVARFIEPVLNAHDHEQFEVFCYSDVRAADEVAGRLQRHAEHWRDISRTPDEEVAGLIRNDTIDILIDLARHTADNRVSVFARKPAPVQVTWIGYPATSGLSAFDYKIADQYTDPPDQADRLYTEKLIRLPDTSLCYLPEQGGPHIAEPPYFKKGHITFGSFNNLAKVSPVTLALWPKVLKTVPASQLIIKAKSLSDKQPAGRYWTRLPAPA